MDYDRAGRQSMVHRWARVQYLENDTRRGGHGAVCNFLQWLLHGRTQHRNGAGRQSMVHRLLLRSDRENYACRSDHGVSDSFGNAPILTTMRNRRDVISHRSKIGSGLCTGPRRGGRDPMAIPRGRGEHFGRHGVGLGSGWRECAFPVSDMNAYGKHLPAEQRRYRHILVSGKTANYGGK